MGACQSSISSVPRSNRNYHNDLQHVDDSIRIIVARKKMIELNDGYHERAPHPLLGGGNNNKQLQQEQSQTTVAADDITTEEDETEDLCSIIQNIKKNKETNSVLLDNKSSTTNTVNTTETESIRSNETLSFL